MKKILITGLNSYIGNSFANYLTQLPNEYKVEKISLKDKTWIKKDFSRFDVIFHVAGIAHSDTGKISIDKKALYYKVNTDLTIDVAKKASQEGVRQFIFMSSSIVYGDSSPIGIKKIITRNTEPSPENFYSDSKLHAEDGIIRLRNSDFNIAILRPPMIYGKYCKGNYWTLSYLAKKVPIFPYVENERSMLYIENLIEFVKCIIDNNKQGYFFPQNLEYSNTSDIVKIIATVNGRNVYFIKNLDSILKFMSLFSPLINKAFGNFVYEKKMSKYSFNYQNVSLSESIRRTEYKDEIRQ